MSEEIEFSDCDPVTARAKLVDEVGINRPLTELLEEAANLVELEPVDVVHHVGEGLLEKCKTCEPLLAAPSRERCDVQADCPEVGLPRLAPTHAF